MSGFMKHQKELTKNKTNPLNSNPWMKERHFKFSKQFSNSLKQYKGGRWKTK